MPQFWASFNNAHKRIQDGGWAREVTQADFPIFRDVAGVNLRLAAGGVRELHWHQAAEWAVMTYGQCRVTVLDLKGRAYVQDVKEGICGSSAGYPHSLQGLGPDGCEFVIAFDDGRASEFNTLLVTDWFAHTPPDALAQNFGVPAATFKSIRFMICGFSSEGNPGLLPMIRQRCGPASQHRSIGADAVPEGRPGNRPRLAALVSYLAETILARPDWGQVAYHSVVPSLGGSDSVLLAAGIVGATVMPYAIYLQGALPNGEARRTRPVMWHGRSVSPISISPLRWGSPASSISP
jgi:natural resistance-associated macrophage protein/cupin